MFTYKQLLNHWDVITESQFNEVIKYIPKFDNININTIEKDYPINRDELCRILLDAYLVTVSDYAYVEDVDFDSKEISVWDINDIDTLNKVYSDLTKLGWNVYSYEELKEYILEENKQETLMEERENLLELIKHKISDMSFEDLENLNKNL